MKRKIFCDHILTLEYANTAWSIIFVFNSYSKFSFVKHFVTCNLFKRGASKAAEGCLASEAAKLVKTAIENLFTNSQTTCAWK